jgi:hypothetical protein
VRHRLRRQVDTGEPAAREQLGQPQRRVASSAPQVERVDPGSGRSRRPSTSGRIAPSSAATTVCSLSSAMTSWKRPNRSYGTPAGAVADRGHQDEGGPVERLHQPLGERLGALLVDRVDGSGLLAAPSQASAAT